MESVLSNIIQAQIKSFNHLSLSITNSAVNKSDITFTLFLYLQKKKKKVDNSKRLKPWLGCTIST